MARVSYEKYDKETSHFNDFHISSRFPRFCISDVT